LKITLNEAGFKLWQEKRQTFHESTIAEVPGQISPGASVEIELPDKQFGGRGYYNYNSRIPLRILSFEDIEIDKTFWLTKFHAALDYRLTFYSSENSFRLIFGDSDQIPGLIVDKFGDYIVIQITTAGIEKYSTDILDTLEEMFQPKGVVLACDSLPRKKEGLELYRVQARGEPISGPISARVDGVNHLIDVLHGHKTGFFLDHRKNRELAAKLCNGKNVLDMFCFSGAFGLNAALNEADQVTSVDIHEPSLTLGRGSAELNKLPVNVNFIKSEGFDFLLKTDKNWDLIFLDPPSFVRGNRRSKRNLSNYRKINTLALKSLSPGGILISSCCSFHVSRSEYLGVLKTSMQNAEQTGKIFHVGCQSPDHPIVPGVDGTDYLKCFFLKTDPRVTSISSK